MLLSFYQIFILLLGHLNFFLHFFFTFMENLLKKHPILCPNNALVKACTHSNTPQFQVTPIVIKRTSNWACSSGINGNNALRPQQKMLVTQ